MRQADRRRWIWMAGGAIAGLASGWLAFDAPVGRVIVVVAGAALGWLIQSVVWGAQKPQ